MRRRPHALHLTVAAAVAFAAAGTVVAVAPATAAGERMSYVVQLTEAPLASYRGGLAGLPATNPAATGKTRLDVTSAASRAYLGHLSVRHAAVEKALEAAVGRDITRAHDYRYAYNGFAASLTAAEARRLQSVPGVLRVQPAVLRQLLTDVGPAWIGAPTVWNGAKTPGGAPNQGEGVVVGVIDTGVNSDHPSFADVDVLGYDHTNPRKNLLGLPAYYGLCDPVLGRPFCNDKLIGVYDFTGTSPEDDNQHGSHTASTTAGNHVDAVLDAPTNVYRSRISGVAPHANLITYKACTVPGCLSPSTVAAIDQATADGVDVINYSIGGGSTDPWTDPDAQAFLGARDAGVFVAASAGNSGPAASTVGSPSDAPWVTSVAASTHNRAFGNSLATSGGKTAPGLLAGGGFTGGYGPAPVVDAKNFGDELCGTPFLPGTFSGQIVLCKRGVNPRVEKGTNVKTGGAGGMVLLNTAADGESTVADAHVLPAVHLGFSAAQKVLAWVNDGGTGHTGTISGATASTAPTNGDVMAGFSSRGPNKSVPGVLKPDISAPGVDILAAVHTTDPTAGPEFGLLSGTSMSGPHLAGSAALVRGVHPEWTVAQVQSALMTTATDSMRKEDGTTPSDPFDRGAGRVDLTRATLAGLTLETRGPTGDRETFTAANPAVGGNPSALNLPSMASSSCAATCTWVRTVTNVLPTPATWDISSVVPAGMKLTAKPSRVTLAPGQSVPITVTADVTGLRAGTWRFAKLTMVERARQAPGVHLPVAVLPGGAPVPVNLVSTGPSGTATQTLTAPARINGLTTNVLGLAKGLAKTVQVSQDPTPLDPYDSPQEGVGSRTEVVSVAEGARVLAAEIASTTANDLDLFVGLDANGDGVAVATEEVCRSASETALESCLLANPKPGQYWVVVQNFLTGQVVDDAELVVANVPGTNAGNLTATGPSGVVAAGKPYDVTLTWKDLGMEPGTTWFGLVELGLDRKATPGSAGSLLVRIDRD